MISSTSHLVDPGLKTYLNQSLKKCHKIRTGYYSFWFNISLFTAFIIVFGGLLLYMYKGKLTPLEKQQKHEQDRRYIMQKIKTLQIEKEKKYNKRSMITNLPQWEGPYRA
jgi:hypothetical protein